MINLQYMIKNIQKMQNFQGDFLLNEPMKKHTTFKIGGESQVFAAPKNEKSLLLLLQETIKNNIPYFILGGGSNIVVSDSGIDGITISTELLHDISIIEKQNNDSRIVRCSSGCTIQSLIDYCIEHELTGLEQFAGLPGTVGGALYMNARCYDVSISDVLTKAAYTTSNDFTQQHIYTMDANDWDYKKSPFQSDQCTSVILSADFSVKQGVKSEIEKKSQWYIDDREKKGHFSYPTAGSVFKNNRDFGKPSGQIIDLAGLKGFTIGGAQVSTWHGNLIINLGSASADNIRDIVTHVQKTVKNNAGYDLECEILFVGNFI